MLCIEIFQTLKSKKFLLRVSAREYSWVAVSRVRIDTIAARIMESFRSDRVDHINRDYGYLCETTRRSDFQIPVPSERPIVPSCTAM
jgi:hypothetical protein